MIPYRAVLHPLPGSIATSIQIHMSYNKKDLATKFIIMVMVMTRLAMMMTMMKTLFPATNAALYLMPHPKVGFLINAAAFIRSTIL